MWMQIVVQADDIHSVLILPLTLSWRSRDDKGKKEQNWSNAKIKWFSTNETQEIKVMEVTHSVVYLQKNH